MPRRLNILRDSQRVEIRPQRWLHIVRAAESRYAKVSECNTKLPSLDIRLGLSAQEISQVLLETELLGIELLRFIGDNCMPTSREAQYALPLVLLRSAPAHVLRCKKAGRMRWARVDRALLVGVVLGCIDLSN